MLGWYTKPFESLILFILISFTSMGILGMGIGMEMKDGQMSSCPFMAGQEAICQMNITEHLTQWQKAFLGMPTKTNLFVLAVVLFVVVSSPFIKAFSKIEELTKFAAQLLAYYKAHIVKIFDSLLLAFSDGILNSRIYEPTDI